MSFLETSNGEGANPELRPPKSQLEELPQLSSDTLQRPDMPPPMPKQDFSSVKTPRPDITAGLKHDAVVHAMMKQGVTNEVDAVDFLQFLPGAANHLLRSCTASAAHPISISSH